MSFTEADYCYLGDSSYALNLWATYEFLNHSFINSFIHSQRKDKWTFLFFSIEFNATKKTGLIFFFQLP